MSQLGKLAAKRGLTVERLGSFLNLENGLKAAAVVAVVGGAVFGGNALNVQKAFAHGESGPYGSPIIASIKDPLPMALNPELVAKAGPMLSAPYTRHSMVIDSGNMDIADDIDTRAKAELDAFDAIVQALEQSDQFLDPSVSAKVKSDAIMGSINAAVTADPASVGGYDHYAFTLGSNLPPHGAFADAIENLNFKRDLVNKVSGQMQDLIVAFYADDSQKIYDQIGLLEGTMKDYRLGAAMEALQESGMNAAMGQVGEEGPSDDNTADAAPELRDVSNPLTGALKGLALGAGAGLIFKGATHPHQTMDKLKSFFHGDDDTEKKPTHHRHAAPTNS